LLRCAEVDAKNHRHPQYFTYLSVCTSRGIERSGGRLSVCTPVKEGKGLVVLRGKKTLQGHQRKNERRERGEERRERRVRERGVEEEEEEEREGSLKGQPPSNWQ